MDYNQSNSDINEFIKFNQMLNNDFNTFFTNMNEFQNIAFCIIEMCKKMFLEHKNKFVCRIIELYCLQKTLFQKTLFQAFSIFLVTATFKIFNQVIVSSLLDMVMRP